MQKEALYADYGKFKKKVREYNVIKQNIDSILRTEHQAEQNRENKELSVEIRLYKSYNMNYNFTFNCNIQP